MQSLEPIVALSTVPGVSAIAVIRLSGNGCIGIVQKVFKGKDLTIQPSHTVHFGKLLGRDGLIDEVVVTVFRAPTSFTKEESVEISCHGSTLIASKIIQTLIHAGARLATPGEFTRRAYLNGRFDLTQAEAVADLIHAENEIAHQSALHQMRGGFKKELENLRQELIQFASLVELELDFGEEDVEFVKRDELKNMVLRLQSFIAPLIDSFQAGNVIKNGIRTVIAGKPNAGKSTLLNSLLNEERAIVSEIPGTTRDVIEDVIHINGLAIRFIDTAGIRDTEDPIEAIGVDRTFQEMRKSSLILYLVDISNSTLDEISYQEERLKELGAPYIMVGNKMDLASDKSLINHFKSNSYALISAKEKEQLDDLKQKITGLFQNLKPPQDGTLVTNLRHYEHLIETQTALTRVISGLDNRVTGDFVAMDIRQSLYHLGSITGEISTDDLLDSIFSRFCIGK
jgi:tRNA modification GTPase